MWRYRKGHEVIKSRSVIRNLHRNLVVDVSPWRKTVGKIKRLSDQLTSLLLALRKTLLHFFLYYLTAFLSVSPWVVAASLASPPPVPKVASSSLECAVKPRADYTLCSGYLVLLFVV